MASSLQKMPFTHYELYTKYLALGWAAGSLRLVGVNMHSGGSVCIHANHNIVKNQLTTLAAAGYSDDLAVLDAHFLGICL